MPGLSEAIRSGQSGKFPQSTLLGLDIVETACKNDLTGFDVNCIFIFEGQGVIGVARDESGDVVLAGLEVGHDKVIRVVHDEMLFTVRHIAATEIHSALGLHHDAVQVELVPKARHQAARFFLFAGPILSIRIGHAVECLTPEANSRRSNDACDKGGVSYRNHFI